MRGIFERFSIDTARAPLRVPPLHNEPRVLEDFQMFGDRRQAHLGEKRFREVGFTAEDFANGGSDRLVDAIVVWGNEAKIHERMDAYYKAGASHVCIMPLKSEGGLVPDARALEALAPR